MDPETILEYALFQLTPTRTRCDLVVFSKGKSEKLASGLVEPFVSHLKYAKDQIPKGGYSISLRPPTANASWFTKSTFLRLVRFISSPEILERFVRLEKEILQIESSVQSTEVSSADTEANAEEGILSSGNGITKKSVDSAKGKTPEASDEAKEENSKMQLQRLLETRKTLLRKEQAMAYARALAAGFEVENMDDLLLFADHFGASRLREACIDFMELCNKKNTDRLWMDELAAMAAYPPSELAYSGTSGVLLTSESIASSYNALNSQRSLDSPSDMNASQTNLDGNKDNILPPSMPANVQAQMPWLNQIPQYMYNFPGPAPHLSPGQAYPYHGMQPMPPYYPGHVQWPQNIRKKGKSTKVRESDASEEGEESESSGSDPKSDSNVSTKHEKSSSNKKHRKKSSKTVVIRNINYITSKAKNGENEDSDDSSVESESVDEDSIKQRVDEVIGSLDKHHKSSKSRKSKKKGANGFIDQNVEFGQAEDNSESGGRKQNEKSPWDAFQILLMKDEEKRQVLDLQDEHFTIKTSDGGSNIAAKQAINLEYEKVTAQPKITEDSFVMPERDGVSGDGLNLRDFADGDNFRPSMKGRDSSDAILLTSQRQDDTGRISDFHPDSSTIRNVKAEDWFVVNHSESETQERSIAKTNFNDDCTVSMGKNKDVVPIDDSFMVHGRSLVDDQYDSQWKTVVSMAETSMANVPEVKGSERESYEPDDLCMLVSRDSVLESSVASWTPEMDYGSGVSFAKAEQKSAPVEMTEQTEDDLASKSNGKKPVVAKNVGKDGKPRVTKGSLPFSRADTFPKKRISSAKPVVPKTKAEREEENRKRMEELAIERQKRIAERTAATASANAVPVRSKTGTTVTAKGPVASQNSLKKQSPKVVGTSKA